MQAAIEALRVVKDNRKLEPRAGIDHRDCRGHAAQMMLNLMAELDGAKNVGRVTGAMVAAPATTEQLQQPTFQVRSMRVPFSDLPEPDEAAFHQKLAVNECMVLVKEEKGISIEVRPRLITIQIEPWTSRARLINLVIFVWEYIPAEIVKHISLCHQAGGQIVKKVDIQKVTEEIKLDLWRYLKKADP